MVLLATHGRKKHPQRLTVPKTATSLAALHAQVENPFSREPVSPVPSEDPEHVGELEVGQSICSTAPSVRAST